MVRARGGLHVNPADVSRDDVALICKFARRVPDADKDAFFAYCATRIRMGGPEDVLQCVRDAFQLFAPPMYQSRRYA
jgi:hypothetical protein